MVGYELMFQQDVHRYVKFAYDLFHAAKLSVVLKKQLEK
jgi:hypothetical protein